MFTRQPLQFVHQVDSGNHTITGVSLPKCGVLIAAATEDKYLAIADGGAQMPDDQRTTSYA